MIRSVAYGNAVLAGMAGAVAWEILARPLIGAGVPFFDIVGTLGTVVLPDASPWASWGLGFLLHLVVGAIWAVFYGYFFWSVLPVRPTLQGRIRCGQKLGPELPHRWRPMFRFCGGRSATAWPSPASLTL